MQRKARRINSPIDKFLANHLRNRTLSLRRELKRLYFQTAIQEAEGNSAKSWKAVKCLSCNTNKKETIICINGKIKPTEIASEKLLNSISDSKATANDGIPIRFLKWSQR